MISIEKLLRLDRRLSPLNWMVSRFDSPVSERGKGIVVIKLGGMGSIIRFISFCEKNGVDLGSFRLITFYNNREMCEMMKLPLVSYIRTDGFWHFIADCLSIRTAIANRPPGCIIDLERGSHLVSLFRQWLAWTSRAKTVSFGFFPRTSKHHHQHDVRNCPFGRMIEVVVAILPKGSMAHDTNSPPQPDPNKIIVNINASDYLPARRYPASGYIEVVARLHLAMPEARFYFTGVDVEKENVDRVVDQLSDSGIAAYSVAGKWSLKRLAEELATAEALITGDSGPLHLAVHLGTPTVAIWGPTQPSQFGYQKNPHLLNLTLALPCSPCFKHPHSTAMESCQGKVDCLVDLKPSSIAKQILTWMARRSVPQPVIAE